MPLRTLKHKLKDLTADPRFAGIIIGSAWALACQVLATVVGMVASVLVARLYGAEVLGTLAMVNSATCLLTVVAVMGTDCAILRLLPEHLVKYSPSSAYRVYRKTLGLVIANSLLLGLLLLATSGILAVTVFAKPQLAYYLVIIAFFLIFSSISNLAPQVVRGLSSVRLFGLLLTAQPLLNLLFLILLTWLFFHPDTPVYSLMSSLAVSSLLGWGIVERYFKPRLKAADFVQHLPLRTIFDISLPMLITASLYFLISQSGVMILGLFHPAEQVGLYAVALKLANPIAFIPTAVSAIIAPRFSELFHAGKMDELFYVARKSTKLIFWSTTPLLVFLLILGKPLLILVFGAKFGAAYPSLALLLAGQFASGACGATGFFIYMTGEEKILRNYTILTALLSLVLSFILIPQFGLTGAAFTTALGITFLNGVLLLYIRNKHGRGTGYFPLLSRDI